MLTPAVLIQKKRDGLELSSEELTSFIRGIATGEVADYQATAFLMATFFRGMTPTETVALTRAMLQSGECIDLSGVKGPTVDKHSTGGVGDKVTLILGPLAAACGLKVPSIAGRGLGHSGGTLDKLEAIPGFNVNLGAAEFVRVLNEVGCSIIGQTAQMVPADKKLYALRDVTATVDCLPLICGSILSKKLAEGTQALVLDVKVGSGAFMKTRKQARELARALTRVSRKLGLPCRAVLTDMNQPLGYAVGNALEVRECIEVLKGEAPAGLSSVDLREVTIALCAHMLQLGGLAKSFAAGRKLASDKLADGSAWRVFEKFVTAQGGDVASVRDPSRLARAPRQIPWKARRSGYLSRIDTETIGRIGVELGGGRKKASDTVDPGVGLVFHKKLGTAVKKGEVLVTVHASAKTDLAPLEGMFQSAVEITATRKPAPKLVYESF